MFLLGTERMKALQKAFFCEDMEVEGQGMVRFGGGAALVIRKVKVTVQVGYRWESVMLDVVKGALPLLMGNAGFKAFGIDFMSDGTIKQEGKILATWEVGKLPMLMLERRGKPVQGVGCREAEKAGDDAVLGTGELEAEEEERKTQAASDEEDALSGDEGWGSWGDPEDDAVLVGMVEDMLEDTAETLGEAPWRKRKKKKRANSNQQSSSAAPCAAEVKPGRVVTNLHSSSAAPSAAETSNRFKALESDDEEVEEVSESEATEKEHGGDSTSETETEKSKESPSRAPK